MRLFVAVPLPPDAHQAAVLELRFLRELGWPVRWVRDDGLHITLKFFGEVAPDRLDTIAEMLGYAVERVAPMTLAITGGGAFPDASRPRVLRLDITPDPALELLQDRIERGGEDIGFPPEGRPFHPHITLGFDRCAVGSSKHDGEDALVFKHAIASIAAPNAMSDNFPAPPA